MNDVAMLVARLFLGVPFVIWGVMKLRGGEAKLVPGLRAMGLPDAGLLAFLIALCEFTGGVMVVIGYPARTAGVLLGLWCLATGYDAHRKDMDSLLLHVVAAGGFFVLATAGPGALALFGDDPSGFLGFLR